MKIKINEIELELEDGASIEIAPDGKITVKAGEPKTAGKWYPYVPMPYPCPFSQPIRLDPTWVNPSVTCGSENLNLSITALNEMNCSTYKLM